METEKLKPVICVLNPDDIFYLRKYSNCTDSLPYCLTIKDVKELQAQGVEIQDTLCKENIILTKLPNLKKYIYRKPEDENILIESRIKTIADILSYLGAKSCTISYSSSNKIDCTSGLNINANVDVKGNVGIGKTSIENGINFSAGVNSKNNQNSVYNTDIASENKWPGKYTEEGYNKAKKIAVETGLDKDSGIKSLIEQRNPSHPNPITSNHYRIELYSSMRKSLEIATNIKFSVSKSLNLPKEVNANNSINAGIDADITKNEFAESHEIMDLQIEFGPYISKNNSEKTKEETINKEQHSINREISKGKATVIIVITIIITILTTISIMKYIL